MAEDAGPSRPSPAPTSLGRRVSLGRSLRPPAASPLASPSVASSRIEYPTCLHSLSSGFLGKVLEASDVDSYLTVEVVPMDERHMKLCHIGYWFVASLHKSTIFMFEDQSLLTLAILSPCNMKEQQSMPST